jgi:hypothetical protein
LYQIIFNVYFDVVKKRAWNFIFIFITPIIYFPLCLRTIIGQRWSTNILFCIYTGNNWGIDPETGKGCKGCAEKQDCFVNCADITIISTGAPKPTTTTSTTAKSTTTITENNFACPDDMSPIPDNGKHCTANDPSQQDVVQFCGTMCSRSTCCPKSHCVCM